jgi:SAM-dependent methyltransferase
MKILGMRCRLCGCEELRLFYTQGDRDQFRFYRCTVCQLVNYDLSGGLDQEKYALSFPDPLDTSLATNALQAQTYDFVRRHVTCRGRLLDIGAGNGCLLHLAREDGWTVKGLELSPFLAASIRARLGIDVTDGNFLEDDVEGRPYDVVVLRHVLEHLPDPVRALSRINCLLIPAGAAVFEFPNIDALDLKMKRFLARTRLHRKRFSPEYRPGHCCEYSRRSFRHLAERTGFELLVWQTYSRQRFFNSLYTRIPIGNKARVLARKRHDVSPFSTMPAIPRA